MWITITTLAVVVAIGFWFPTACFAVIRMGIREYFRQKRIYLLEMLNNEGIPVDAKEHK